MLNENFNNRIFSLEEDLLLSSSNNDNQTTTHDIFSNPPSINSFIIKDSLPGNADDKIFAPVDESDLLFEKDKKVAQPFSNPPAENLSGVKDELNNRIFGEIFLPTTSEPVTDISSSSDDKIFDFVFDDDIFGVNQAQKPTEEIIDTLNRIVSATATREYRTVSDNSFRTEEALRPLKDSYINAANVHHLEDALSENLTNLSLQINKYKELGSALSDDMKNYYTQNKEHLILIQQ